ncbi:uncharacterized protein LOC144159580 [Haemaphysalis longicornis]
MATAPGEFPTTRSRPDVPASTHRRRSTRSQSRALRGSQTADSWDDLSWDATIPEVDGAKSGDRSTTGRGRSLLNPRKLRRSMLSNPPRKFRCHACGYRTKYKMDLLNHVEHHAVSDTRDSHPQQHAPGQTHDSAGDVSRDFASNVAARAQPRGGEGTTKTEARLSKPKALKHSVVTGAPRKFCCHVCPFWTKYKNALLRHVNRHGDLQFKCGKRPAHGLPNAKLCLKRVTGTHARTTQRQGNKTKTTIDVKGGGPSQRADDASNDVTASKSEGSLPKAQRASSATEPVRSHAGVKPFGCGFCSRRFTRRAHLIVHVRLHTGEKPFKCEFCPRRFATKSQLVQHTRLHTGEKPYKCSACSLAFRLRKSLMVHMRSHSG